MDNENKITVTYNLPTSIDGNVFGPAFWSAFHDLADKVPCGGCKEHAVSFMNFFHDMVNYHLGKKIYDKKNFIMWINKISKLKNKPLILK